MSAPPVFGRAICGDLEQALRREWLVTNGLGGYAAGTLAGAQTRRYHGLLVAAEQPPVGRTVRLVDLDVTARVLGADHALGCHEYADGSVHPHGYRLVERFALEGTVPAWTYALGPALLTRRVYMARGRNTTYVTYTLERAPGPVELVIRPLCTTRDYHWHRHGIDGYAVEAATDGCRVVTAGSAADLRLSVAGGAFHGAPDGHWNVYHRAEAARGLDAREDLYTPGSFVVTLALGASAAVVATIEAGPVADAAAALAELRRHESGLLASFAAPAPAWIAQLVLAADQFLVARRGAAGEADGTTVIAGYPWFSDWGRDTMIALPGLTLATGRPALAAGILRTFAGHVSAGLLPNRFPDAGEAPEYNTVDATLWYFVAIHEYLRATGDAALGRELYPVLVGIVDWHLRGTRHGIGADPADGLLRAGEPGVQLTWMDAKVGDWVVTPRVGKPVEINALWCNALRILAALAGDVGDAARARDLGRRADLAARAFAQRFWHAAGQYLYDVVDVPGAAGPDATLRPNQLIALALPHPLLDAPRARAVLAACERELVTSCGLRTLAPGDPAYVGRYRGDQRQRDGAYHQGTVWPWLLGLYARAHLRLHGDAAAAARYLAPLEQHLADACVGQISEIFDADPPHAPQGCFAQAWSVSETLHAWRALSAAAADGQNPRKHTTRVTRTRKAS